MFFPRPHEVSHKWCHSKFPTILSLLKIENVNVLNFLIEKKKVERVIIIDNESAWKLLRSIETSPHNLLYALTFNDNGSGITQWYPVPNYRSYQVKQNPDYFGKLQTSETKYLGIMPAKPSTTPPAASLPKNQLLSETVPNCPPPSSTPTPTPKDAPLPKIELEQSISELDAINIEPLEIKVAQKWQPKSPITLQGNLNNYLALYSEKMPKLVFEILKNPNRFQKVPIGPLGMEVKVKENVPKKFVKVIETDLGKLLSAFLVDNDQDKRVLDRLAKMVGINITIIASKYLER